MIFHPVPSVCLHSQQSMLGHVSRTKKMPRFTVLFSSQKLCLIQKLWKQSTVGSHTSSAYIQQLTWPATLYVFIWLFQIEGKHHNSSYKWTLKKFGIKNLMLIKLSHFWDVYNLLPLVAPLRWKSSVVLLKNLLNNKVWKQEAGHALSTHAALEWLEWGVIHHYMHGAVI